MRDAARFVIHGTRVVVRGAGTLVRLARPGALRDSLRPWMRFARAEDIPFALLHQQGIRAVLFDLENTLVPPGGPFTVEARDVVAAARSAGLAVGVVTNCSGLWVGRCLTDEGLPFVAPAGKPGRAAFTSACRTLGVRPAQTVFVGDQMITDVLGAQRAGMRAILLEPRYAGEALSSRFQRAVAKGVLRLTGGA